MHTLVEVTTAGNGSSHVPAFLAKLWKIVDDPTTNDLICWSQVGMGNSFIIRNQAKFARDLLPLYYKHNNMASFVRQLNMYGFHKVVSVEQGGLRLEKDEMEFAHPFFLRGQEGSLELIKRKIPTTKHEDTRTRPDSLNKVLLDVRQMKGRQESMDSKLITMKRENEALWRELSSLRQKHAKQTQIVSKLLQFLVGMMSSQTHRLGFKRRMPLMLNDTVGAKPAKINRTKNGTENRGPVIHDVTELFECNEADEADDASADDANEADEPNVESPSSTSVKSPYPPDALYGLGSVDETVDMLLSVDPLSINPAINVSRKQAKPANKKAKSQTPKPSPKASESSVSTIVAPNSQVQQIIPQMMSQSAIPSTVDQNLPTYFLAGMDDNGQIILTIPDNSNVTQTSNVGNILTDQNTSTSVNAGAEQLSTDIVPVNKETGKQRNQGVTPNSFLKPKFELKDDFDEHLDDVQHGLDNLRDLLKNEQYSIDSSTLLGVGSNNPFNMHNSIDAFSVAKLFGDESNEILGLQQQQLMNQPPLANTAESDNDGQAQSGELVSYNPSLYELTEDDTNFFDEATNMYLSHELDSMLTTDRDKLNQGNGYPPLSFSEVVVGNPGDSSSINTPVGENPVMTFNFDDFSSPAPPAPPVNTSTAPSTSGAAKRKRK